MIHTVLIGDILEYLDRCVYAGSGKAEEVGKKDTLSVRQDAKINHSQALTATDTAFRQLAANVAPTSSARERAGRAGLASRSRGWMHDAREPLDPDFEPQLTRTPRGRGIAFLLE